MVVYWFNGMREDYRIFFHDNTSKHNIKLKKDYVEKFRETTGTEIKIQHWDGNRQLSMEVFAVEYFPNPIDPGRNERKP